MGVPGLAFFILIHMLDQIPGTELFFELLSEEIEILIRDLESNSPYLTDERLQEILPMLEEFHSTSVEWDEWDIVDKLEIVLDKLYEKLEIC
jgi:hypothetical protein